MGRFGRFPHLAAAVRQADVQHLYIMLHSQVTEYAVAVAVWHTGLTADLSDQLELIQKHALCIIFGGSSVTNQSYDINISVIN